MATTISFVLYGIWGLMVSFLLLKHDNETRDLKEFFRSNLIDHSKKNFEMALWASLRIKKLEDKMDRVYKYLEVEEKEIPSKEKEVKLVKIKK
jgi:hypothetical protein